MYKSFTVIFIGLLGLFCNLPLLAQSSPPGVKTDRGIYPEPSPLPPIPTTAGGMTVDPVFGTTIIRVTTPADWPSPGCGTFYNQWPTFNADNTKMMIRCGIEGDVIFKSFDPATLAVGPIIKTNPRLPGGVSVQWQGAMWSRTDPNVLYCHPVNFDADYPSSGAKLYSYSFVTGQFTLVRDFGPAIGASDWFFEMHVAQDGNDDIFTFGQFRTGQENPFKYLIYKRSTNTILLNISSKDARLFPTNGTNVALPDKSARYVFFSENGTPTADQRRIARWDLQTDVWQYVSWNNAGDSPGHGDLGTGTLFGRGAFSGAENIRNLSDVSVKTNLFDWKIPPTNAIDWSEDCHSNLYADDESWALLGCYDESDVGESGALQGEILQISTSNPNAIRRLAHHYSLVLNQNLGTNGYWAIPKPTISRDGRFVVFTSNWGNMGRTDAFIVVVSVVTSPSPTPTPTATPTPLPSPSVTPSPSPSPTASPTPSTKRCKIWPPNKWFSCL